MQKQHLTQEQRYPIFRMLQAECTRKEICTATGKDQSVISRELKRNDSKRVYSPLQAQVYADERKERFRRKRTFTEAIRAKVVRELTEKQSGRRNKSLAERVERASRWSATNEFTNTSAPTKNREERSIRIFGIGLCTVNDP
jgi:IS30 family transposase